MNWFISTLSSSIGKKLLMAVTGLGFCIFLIIHLIGNLTIYGGKDFFISYVEHLHSLGALIIVAEIGLLFFAAIHITTGLILFFQNRIARPEPYTVNKSAGGQTFSSSVMPYTGLLIFGFIIIHLLNVRFIDLSQNSIFNVLTDLFSFFPNVILYAGAVIIVALHVRHGFWSLFQTLGANHPKYMPMIKKTSLVFAFIIAAGFGFIPFYIGFFLS
jgi:succinate dehydrogenase / fumarate reductase cytochrome b subunit